jgi:hypothetical protein
LAKSKRRLRRHLSNVGIYKRTIHAVEKTYYDNESKTTKSIWVDEHIGKVINVEPKKI